MGGGPMARAMWIRAVGRARFIGVSLAALAMVLGVAPATALVQEKPAFELWDFGVVPRPSVMMALLSFEPVQQELKMTEAQRKEQQAVLQRQQREMQQKMQQARRNTQEREKAQAALATVANEAQAAI